MQGRCEKHIFEESEDRCGKCGHEYCPECLVYSFGPKKPPFCIPCAVAAAGIRSTAGNNPMLAKRDLKQLQRHRKLTLRRLGRSEPEPQPVLDDVAGASAPLMPTAMPFPQALGQA